jgi:hypothetical protein
MVDDAFFGLFGELGNLAGQVAQLIGETGGVLFDRSLGLGFARLRRRLLRAHGGDLAPQRFDFGMEVDVAHERKALLLSGETYQVNRA